MPWRPSYSRHFDVARHYLRNLKEAHFSRQSTSKNIKISKIFIYFPSISISILDSGYDNACENPRKAWDSTRLLKFPSFSKESIQFSFQIIYVDLNKLIPIDFNLFSIDSQSDRNHILKSLLMRHTFEGLAKLCNLSVFLRRRKYFVPAFLILEHL